MLLLISTCKLVPVQYKCNVPPQNLLRKYAVKMSKLMLYKSLFIIHVTIKGLLKSYAVVQK